MTRVRLVVEPLSDYVRWELTAMRWSVEAGEDIRVLPAGQAGAWPAVDDFWLFDDTLAVRMEYDTGGRFLGGRPSDDVAPLLAVRERALAAAIPLAEYARGA